MNSILSTLGIFAFLSVLPLSRIQAEQYSLTEIDAILNLPAPWVPVNNNIISRLNSEVLNRLPQSTIRTIAGFTRGTPADGSKFGKSYILIQNTPRLTPYFTPEQIVSILPKTTKNNEAELKRLLNNKVASIEPSVAHYEPSLNAVVYTTSDTLSNGSVLKLCCYLVLRKSAIISVNAYSNPENADLVFEEVRGIVSTLKFAEDEKMPESWIDRLKQLLQSQ